MQKAWPLFRYPLGYIDNITESFMKKKINVFEYDQLLNSKILKIKPKLRYFTAVLNTFM